LGSGRSRGWDDDGDGSFDVVDDEVNERWEEIRPGKQQHEHHIVQRLMHEARKNREHKDDDQGQYLRNRKRYNAPDSNGDREVGSSDDERWNAQ
jgi:hypothetical protein